MDSTILWILIFAVAVIFLLAIFLVASERELKRSRRELEARAAGDAEGAAATTGEAGADGADAQAAGELRNRVRELEVALAAASIQREENQQAAQELQAAKEAMNATKSTTDNLQRENQQLQSQIAEFKQNLETASHNTPATDTQIQLSEREAQLNAEIATLNQELQAAQAQAQESSAVRDQLAQASARINDLQLGQQNLQNQLKSATDELTDKQHKISALETRIEEIQEAQDSIDQWHDWVTARQQQVSDAQNQWQDWLAKQEALRQDQQQLATAFNSLKQAMDFPPTAHESGITPVNRSATLSQNESDAANTGTAATTQAAESPAASTAPQQTTNEPGGDSAQSTNKHTVGIVAALFFVCVTGVLLAYSFQRTSKETPEVKALTDRHAAATPVLRLEGPSAMLIDNTTLDSNHQEASETGINTAASAAMDTQEAPQLAKAEVRNQPAALKTPTKKQNLQPAWGLYQTIQPGRVYNGPNENSELIADLPAGVKLNVVSVKNGWLEVRSKHGRPPGFIRQESATRVETQP